MEAESYSSQLPHDADIRAHLITRAILRTEYSPASQQGPPVCQVFKRGSEALSFASETAGATRRLSYHPHEHAGISPRRPPEKQPELWSPPAWARLLWPLLSHPGQGKRPSLSSPYPSWVGLCPIWVRLRGRAKNSPSNREKRCPTNGKGSTAHYPSTYYNRHKGAGRPTGS